MELKNLEFIDFVEEKIPNLGLIVFSLFILSHYQRNIKFF